MRGGDLAALELGSWLLFYRNVNMAQILDDKSEHCIPFILERLAAHRELYGKDAPPFFIGLNGVQGAGKTTLVSGVFDFYLLLVLHLLSQNSMSANRRRGEHEDCDGHLNEPNI